MADAPLILVPTKLELDRVLEAWPTADETRSGGPDPIGRVPRFELCGLGPVAAAARTAALVAADRPGEILLLGIAGTYDATSAPPGTARRVGGVVLDGIGAGEGDSFVSLRELGFPQWETPGASGAPGAPAEDDAIHDRIVLDPPGTPIGETGSEGSEGEGALLVTVLASSASPGQAERRADRFPRALLEDMEGFGVALACRLAGVPLRIIRGVSNEAGDRRRERWRVHEALEAAVSLAVS